MGKFLVGVLIFVGLLQMGCGPEESAKEKFDRQTKQNVAADQSACAPFAGLYEGKFKLDSGNILNARLYLVPISILSTNSSGGIVETPTLGGSLVEPYKDSLGQMQVRPIYTFGFAKCYPENKKVVLYLSSINTLGYNPNSYLNGNLDGIRLSGRVITALKPDVGIVDVTKVEKSR